MISLPSTSADRLSQLVLMLSSTHDGEVLNAARAIGRLLYAERWTGTCWLPASARRSRNPPTTNRALSSTRKPDAVRDSSVEVK